MRAMMRELLADSKLRLVLLGAGGIALGAYWLVRRRMMDEEDQRAWKEERACLNMLGIETKLNGAEIAVGNGVVGRREKNGKKMRPGSLKQVALDVITQSRGCSYVELWGRDGFVVQQARKMLEQTGGGHECIRKITEAANHLAASLLYRQEAARQSPRKDELYASLKAEIANTEIQLRQLTKQDPALRSRREQMAMSKFLLSSDKDCPPLSRTVRVS